MNEEPINGNGTQPDLPGIETLSADDKEQFGVLMGKLRTMEQTTFMLERMAFARANGYTFDGRRNVGWTLGYAAQLTPEDYWNRYTRGGIAGRIVDAPPDATWRGNPAFEIIEDETKDTNTPFEQAWVNFDKRLQVQAKFRRVDKLASLSTYAVLLIGTPDGRLEEELPRLKGTPDAHKQIIYLQPFYGGGGPNTKNVSRTKMVADGADATIDSYDTDPKSPRFGLPLLYRIPRLEYDQVLRKVHWSRIIHIAENLLDDEVFGLPALERVWNYLDDLDKVVGGGAEAFWLRANQGLHLDVDKDMQQKDLTATLEALKAQSEEYKHQITRWLRTRGVKVNTLGSDVANFGPNADSITTLIAGSKGIPKRILTGSELGELASSQDRDNWADQVTGRQQQFAGPYVVRQLVDRLITYGYLPTPGKGVDGYEVVWPKKQTMTEQERTDGALKWSQTKVNNDPVFTNAEIRDHWFSMAPLSKKQLKEIDDRSALKQEQAAEAAAEMARANPPRTSPQLVKAAEEYVPKPEDEELALLLAQAIEAGNDAVVASILGLEDA